MKKFLNILYFLLTFGPTAMAASTQTTTIMVFGDSLSAGYGMPIEAGWVHLLEQRLKSTAYHIVNTSISGETTLGGRNRIKQALQLHRPEIVILELGANDGLRGSSIKSIYENLEAIIKDCRQNDVLVLLTGMQLPPNYGITYTQKFQDIFPRLANYSHVHLVPFLLAGFGDKQEYFQADGIHPNIAAQEKIVENIWLVLHKILKVDQIAITRDNQ